MEHETIDRQYHHRSDGYKLTVQQEEMLLPLYCARRYWRQLRLLHTSGNLYNDQLQDLTSYVMSTYSL